MSVRVGTLQTAEVPPRTPLARVDANGDVWIWPGGIGFGPAITMSLRDWVAIRNSVESAIGVHGLTDVQRRLVGYTCCEGTIPE